MINLKSLHFYTLLSLTKKYFYLKIPFLTNYITKLSLKTSTTYTQLFAACINPKNEIYLLGIRDAQKTLSPHMYAQALLKTS